MQKGIYQIPYSLLEGFFGENGRSNALLGFSKDIANFPHNGVCSSVLVEHSNMIKHCICIEDNKFHAMVDYFSKRHIREVVEIYKHTNYLNRDGLGIG